MIDIHTHIGLLSDSKESKHKFLSAKGLVQMLDEEKIDKAVVLPLISPESTYSPSTSQDVLAAYREYPDRIIPFANVDPRSGMNRPDTDFSWILEEYKEKGCKGIGEVTPNLYMDDPRVQNLFYHCGKVGLPVLFHVADKIGGVYGLVDEINLPRLEKMLRKFPDTIFIGHAMSFWAEISAEVEEETRGGYPKGPLKKPGRVPELLGKYPNLYGDLSAGSGYNALARDKEYAPKFLEKYQDKLFFGTDYLSPGQKMPIISFLKEINISKQSYQKITQDNACRILRLE